MDVTDGARQSTTFLRMAAASRTVVLCRQNRCAVIS